MFLLCVPMLVNAQNETPKPKSGYVDKMSHFRVKKKDFKKYRYLSFGGGLHFLTYFGDLAPADKFLSTDVSQIKPGISAFAEYRYAPRASLKAELLYGRLTGDDNTSADPSQSASQSRYVRNLSFRNDIIDLSITSHIYLFKNYLDYGQRSLFNAYLIAGLSVFYHNPKGKVPDFKYTGERYPNSGEWVALQPLGTEGQHSSHYDLSPYSRVQLSVPVGGGLKFRLSDQLDFAFEINYRILLTDYIDDVSGKYVDLGALESDMAKSMSDRSREEYAAISGEKRSLDNVETVKYISKYDGNQYIVYRGYGQEGDGARRGGAGKDTFLVSSFKISYVLNKP
ncbi:MAG: hypothetical protein HC819_12310 [Cyclobacteriaceae bacterium]|nr:hypothetical protein [Cyclobacteriaceae bacterium]